MSKEVYPYSIPYKRTQNWYTDKWRDISNWCNECIGPSEWNYYGSEFVFTEEKYKMMFMLRWME